MVKDLSVVIVGFNKGEYTARCLRSLLETTWRPLSVVFVDNGSTDRTPSILSQFKEVAPIHGISVEVLRLERNFGSVMPRNLAIKQCGGDYLALIDNDTIVRSRHIFEILTDVLDRHAEIGIVTPKFLYPVHPYRIQCAGGGVTREGYTFLYGRGTDLDDPEFSFARSVPWSLSACMVMKRALVQRLGPLDEQFSPTGFEDTDYCFRCRTSGLEIGYVPQAEIYHAENITTFGTPGLNIRAAMRRSQRLFRKKWKHMFPDSPSIHEVPNAYRREAAVPLWALSSLPIV